MIGYCESVMEIIFGTLGGTIDLLSDTDLLGRNKIRRCVAGDIAFGIPGIADDANNLRREHLGSRLVEAGFSWENLSKLLKKKSVIDFEVSAVYIFVEHFIICMCNVGSY